MRVHPLRNGELRERGYTVKLFWKLFCSMVAITLAACSIGGFVLIDGQFRTSIVKEEQALWEENFMLSDALSGEVAGCSAAQREELARIVRGFALTTGGQEALFRVCDGDGVVLDGNVSMPSELDPQPLIADLPEGQLVWRLANYGQGSRFLHAASALPLSDGVVYLENCRDVSSLFFQRNDQYRSFFGLMLALIAGVGVLALLVSHLILRPLNSLSDAVAKIAEGELSQRAAVTSGDEIGALARDFNAMAERLEEQMDQLTDAARREKDFTASFAHEIKTPLTSIIGYADLLLSRENSPEQVRDSAGYIFREGRRLEALSGKLMELIVLGREDFPQRTLSLRAFLEQTGNALRPVLEGAGVQFAVEAEECPVRLEPDLMETVCLNLLDNARKATPEGGRITLTGRAGEEGGCVIEVADTGKGIPAEELGRITEPFYMVDKSRSRAQGGAGLGLALCKRIVELHGGTLEFESAPGEGTTARVVLKGGAQG